MYRPSLLVEVLLAACAAVGSLDADMFADGATLVALSTEMSRVEALACRQSAVFDRRGAWATVGAQNAADWICTQTRCERRRACDRIRVGHAMAYMDLAAAAFVAGVIGVDHVDVLAKARDRSKATAVAFGRDEATLVGWASTLKFHQFTRCVEVWLQHADTDDAETRAERQHRQRSFTGALRRAIQVRDRTCQHPYCGQPAERCDIDHIEPWAHSATTTQPNARTLCGHHNRLRNTNNRRKPTRSPHEN